MKTSIQTLETTTPAPTLIEPSSGTVAMKRKWLALLALVLMVGIAYLAYRRFLDFDALVAHEEALRRAISRHPVGATLLGFVVYTLLCFVPGAGGKSLVVGWLFGFWSALVQVNLGLTFVAMVTFWISRYLFREALHQRAGASIAALDRALLRDGAYYLFALRVLHCPYTLTNYILGATSIRSLDFWRATQLGMLPGNILFVYTGSQVPSLGRLAEEGLGGIFTPRLMAALAVLGLVPLLVRLLRRRLFPDTENPLHEERSD